MAESPDYQPIDFTPFPADPASYVNVFNSFDVTTSQQHLITSLTDSKLYVIKEVACSGTMAGTYTGGSSTAYAYIVITNGLNNNGSQSAFDGCQMFFGAAASANSYAVVPFSIQLPTPLVVRAGTVGQPNDIAVQIGCAIGLPTSRVSAICTALLWPLD